MVVQSIIKQCIANQLDILPDDIPNNGLLKEDLFADSQDILLIRLAIEDAFSFEFDVHELACMRNVQDIITCVRAKTQVPLNLLFILTAHSSLRGDKVAFFEKEKSITYSELLNEVRKAQEALHSLGLQSDSFVRLNVCDDISSFILFLALLCEKITVIPSKSTDSIDFPHNYVISKNTVEDKASSTPAYSFECFSEKWYAFSHHTDTNIENIRRLGNGLYINSTSGTSGSKKYCISNWASILANTEAICNCYRINENDVIISLFPAHVHMHESCMRSLLVGGTALIGDSFDVRIIADLIEKHAATQVQGTPSQLLALSKRLSATQAHSVKVVECAGGLLFDKAKKELEKIFTQARIIRAWGSAETTGVCISDYSSNNDIEYCIGSIIPPYEFKIEKTVGQKVGELHLRGSGVVRGIYKNSELIQISDWLNTGDLVRDVNGSIFFVGRRTGMIKYAGENIYPEELENALCNVTGIIDAIATGLFDEESGEIPVAVVQIEDKLSFDVVKIKKELAQNGLEYNKIPKKIVAVRTQLPYVAGGKKDRNAIKEYFN